MKKLITFMTVLFLLFLFLVVQKNAEGDAGYAGEQACKGCHDAYYDSYRQSTHSKKAIAGTPAAQYGCESCHGAGSEHVSKGGGKGVAIFGFGKKLDAKEKSSRCLACHEETKHLVSWNISKHKSSGVGCTDCHSLHAGVGKGLKAEEPQLCFGCHKDIRLQSNKQSHHPVKEGRIKCSDCHNTHGSFGPKMVRADAVNELCYKCHAEKRGPFRFEHPPVEENCLNCHEVHGSNHRSLLVRKTPQLCQSCHESSGHPANPYTKFDTFKGPDTNNRMVSRACLNCHTNVHGSNGPATQGQRFFR